MGNTKRERTLKWIDKTKSSDEKQKQPPPLAKLIPIKDTMKFSHAINNHHEKS